MLKIYRGRRENYYDCCEYILQIFWGLERRREREKERERERERE